MLKENENTSEKEIFPIPDLNISYESIIEIPSNLKEKKRSFENNEIPQYSESNHPFETRNKINQAFSNKNTNDIKSKLNLDTNDKLNYCKNKNLIGNTKLLIRKASLSNFNSKIKTNYLKFIEINRSKFRNYSLNKTETKKSKKYNENENNGDIEGLLSSIKTDKINIKSYNEINVSISKIERKNQCVSVTKQFNEIKEKAIEKNIKEDLNNAHARNVKFFALSHWKRKDNSGFEAVNDEKHDHFYHEDSIRRLRMTNEALFRHRSAPLNPKNKSLYNNSRTFNLKNQLIPIQKEENNLNLLITSKGIFDIPCSKEVKVNTILEEINNHKLRMEMILNNNKKLKKGKMLLGNDIEDRAIKSVATDYKLQSPNDILLFKDVCETFNNYQKERNNKSANPHKQTLFLTQDKKPYTNSNFFNKNNSNEGIFQTLDNNTPSKNKFNNFEQLKNTVFGVRNPSSNTRFSTTGKSKNYVCTNTSQTLTSNSLIRPKSLYHRPLKNEKTLKRIVSGQDNKISNVLYRVLNKKEADSAIQKHKIF